MSLELEVKKEVTIKTEKIVNRPRWRGFWRAFCYIMVCGCVWQKQSQESEPQIIEKRTEKIKTILTKYKVSDSNHEDDDDAKSDELRMEDSSIQKSDQKLLLWKSFSNNSNVEHVSDSEEEILLPSKPAFTFFRTIGKNENLVSSDYNLRVHDGILSQSHTTYIDKDHYSMAKPKTKSTVGVSCSPYKRPIKMSCIDASLKEAYKFFGGNWSKIQ